MNIFDPSRKPKMTPAVRQLMHAKPLAEEFVLPPNPSRNYARPMSRLSFGVLTPKEDRSIRSLYEMMTKGDLVPRFVMPDTGFITTKVHEQFWGLNDDTMFVFPEIIAAELTGWLSSPIHNKNVHSWLERALSKCRSGENRNGPLSYDTVLGEICGDLKEFHVGLLDKAAMLKFGYQHYVDLLSVRKRLGVRHAAKLRVTLGREPSDAELRNSLRREHGERVAPIAFKGRKDFGKRNFVADEELVVSAVIQAIAIGETTVILTRDNDVFEQFTKLVEIITSDYMCYRFGELRHHKPEGIPMSKLEIKTDSSQDHGFIGDYIESVLISQRGTEELPPYKYNPVHCFCVLVGNTPDEPKISIAGYCLEKEMIELLFAKEDASGKNSRHFGERNVVNGMQQKEDGPYAMFAIVEEATEEFEGVQFLKSDLRNMLREKTSIVRKVW